MTIKFADQRIREARQRIVALDRAPPARATLVGTRWHEPDLAAIDGWRAQQEDEPGPGGGDTEASAAEAQKAREVMTKREPTDMKKRVEELERRAERLAAKFLLISGCNSATEKLGRATARSVSRQA